jgi:hypothetical protein
MASHILQYILKLTAEPFGQKAGSSPERIATGYYFNPNSPVKSSPGQPDPPHPHRPTGENDFLSEIRPHIF